jgi:alpha-glucosidase
MIMHSVRTKLIKINTILMKLFDKTYLFASLLLAACPVAVGAQKQFSLYSPDRRLAISVEVGATEVAYSVTHGEDTMIDCSPISVTLADGESFGMNPKLRGTQRRSHDGTIHPPLYRKATIADDYNELTLRFRGDWALVFRAYDDGVAYRFTTTRTGPLVVESEQAVFNLPPASRVWVAYAKGRLNDGVVDPFYSAFQNTYVNIPVEEWDGERIAFAPVLVEGPGGKMICITEADLMNYPGMYIQNRSGGSTLDGVFAPCPRVVKQEVRGLKGVVKEREGYIARFDGRASFPWRVIAVAENDARLLDNDMVYKLASPAAFTDTSWIRPGKVAWDWWNDWNIYNVDFRAGINTETYKYYIDFASRFGIEYVILDEGWSVAEKADLMLVIPEIDLPEIIRHAASKNVGIILWAGYWAFESKMEEVCAHYAAMGVKGFKLDFMDRDDQPMVDFHARAAAATAKHKLMLDFHGTYKPTGLQRTWPNVVNFEGVHGLEEMKWATPETDQVTYDVTLPFIRMVAGPLDYTQGAMDNRTRANFSTIYTEPMSQGTRCRQLAQYVIFESPLNMMCDSPTNYMKEQECTRFIAGVPTVWDQTVPLESKIGEYVAVARRHGDVWYVGGMTSWVACTLEIDLSWLGDGHFTAEVFRDGINADRVGRDYKREVVDVPTDRKINIPMSPGGGFAMKITKTTKQ